MGRVRRIQIVDGGNELGRDFERMAISLLFGGEILPAVGDWPGGIVAKRIAAKTISHSRDHVISPRATL